MERRREGDGEMGRRGQRERTGEESTEGRESMEQRRWERGGIKEKRKEGKV
jgi:hypothetical protein